MDLPFSQSHPLYAATQQLLASSQFAAKYRQLVLSLIQEDDCQTNLAIMDYTKLLQVLSFTLTSNQFASELRKFRHRHLLRIALREMAGWATTIDSMMAWSHCADAIIEHTLNYCAYHLKPRFGEPQHSTGELAHLYTLAMGKLGGQELNFSSDIDLIFAYSAAGCTTGPEPMTNQEYYTKIVQQFVQLLQQVTADGFVFRVDLRLRPHGDSGPLVYSLAALETYYQEQGRDWERYAMVKARLIGQIPGALPPWFNRLIIPFVYRRYVDFSVIESLRSMKALIEREVQLNPALDDLKRGQGGIREIEFIIQCFQLIRGGRMPELRQQNALTALNALTENELLNDTESLREAYIFLRRLENMLQLQNDQQTHTLPATPERQVQMCRGLNISTWDQLRRRLAHHQRIVCEAFAAILSQQDAFADDKRVLANQLLNVWQGHVETGMAINLLTSLGYVNAERCYQLLYAFRHGSRCRRLSQVARLRLDRFMVALLHELAHVSETDNILLQVLHLLEQISGRSAYLALLCENLSVLKELLYWFGNSRFITELFIAQPFLLEVLIDQETGWQPLSKKELQGTLNARLSHCHEHENLAEALRQFKLSHWLLAARAELYNHCDAIRIGLFLADVAEVIIQAVVDQACQQLSDRQPDMESIRANFAIVAYGKLGSREMNYDSDVDLVFLHTVEPEQESLVTRLSQKILHMLTTRTQSGVLYNVDTRLRPSGAAGLLVSRMQAFVEYQQQQAWTWEHQALLRARVICGSWILRKQFKVLKQAVLAQPRDSLQLSQDVQAMRAKIKQHAGQHDIKHVPGGLLDIEFVTQYLMLRASVNPSVHVTHTLKMLKFLLKSGQLAESDYKKLAVAYRTYHRVLHRHLLQTSSEGDIEEAQLISELCQRLYGRSDN